MMPSDEMWRSILAHEPTRKQRHRRYLWEGFCFYCAMFRHDPKRALGIIAGIGFLFGVLYLMLRLDEIAMWVSGVVP